MSKIIEYRFVGPDRMDYATTKTSVEVPVRGTNPPRKTKLYPTAWRWQGEHVWRRIGAAP